MGGAGSRTELGIRPSLKLLVLLPAVAACAVLPSAPPPEPHYAQVLGALDEVPVPSPGQRVDLLRRLSSIDPRLAEDRSRAVVRARLVCRRIRRGLDDRGAGTYAAEVFTGNPHAFPPLEQTSVVAAIVLSFCPRG